ncbi:MAG: hypothetical protein MZU97_25365 [Bacillus subtilis]|nr:hypothetical protein [Bacillus subtilis]
MIGATTRFGDLTGPLRDRFGIVHKLEFYTDGELETICQTNGQRSTIAPTEPAAIVELAKRSRGTPRIVNRLFRRVRDFADIIGDGTITLRNHENGVVETSHRRMRPRHARTATICASSSKNTKAVPSVLKPSRPRSPKIR